MLAGFDYLDDVSPGTRPARETARNAVRGIDSAAGRPFFAWIHLWDPHEPNQPAAKYLPELDDSQFDDLVRERGIDPSRLAHRSSAHVLRRLLYPDHVEVDAAAVHAMLERYDGDVRATDEAVGRVFAKLKALGLRDRAILVVVEDHGRSLGQHDWLDHGAITVRSPTRTCWYRCSPGSRRGSWSNRSGSTRRSRWWT